MATGDAEAGATQDAPPSRGDVRSAGAVVISGEAAIVTFRLELPGNVSDDPWDRVGVERRFRKDQTLRDVAVAIVKKKLGQLLGTYEIEAVMFDGPSVDFVVWGNASETPLQRLLQFGGRRTWAESFDATMEDARRALRKRLRKAGHEGLVRVAWRPGAGVEITESRFDPEAEDASIRQHLGELHARELRIRRQMWSAGAVAAMFLVGGTLFSIVVGPLVGATTLPYVFLGVLLAAAARQSAEAIRSEIREINEHLDLRALLNPEEKRAQRLFTIHSLELKRYYDQALRQRSYIFAVGLFCIAGGFGVVGASFYLLHNDTSQEVTQKLVVGGLGAIGAVLANYVAAVYVKMFAATISSISEFHSRLVLTHHVHFGNFLAAKIQDPGRRESTFRDMAVALAGYSAEDPAHESATSLPDAATSHGPPQLGARDDAASVGRGFLRRLLRP